MVATVGGTNRPENLRTFLECIADPQPLATDIQNQIIALQRRWSDETDIHAEPWSM